MEARRRRASASSLPAYGQCSPQVDCAAMIRSETIIAFIDFFWPWFVIPPVTIRIWTQNRFGWSVGYFRCLLITFISILTFAAVYFIGVTRLPEPVTYIAVPITAFIAVKIGSTLLLSPSGYPIPGSWLYIGLALSFALLSSLGAAALANELVRWRGSGLFNRYSLVLVLGFYIAVVVMIYVLINLTKSQLGQKTQPPGLALIALIMPLVILSSLSVSRWLLHMSEPVLLEVLKVQGVLITSTTLSLWVLMSLAARRLFPFSGVLQLGILTSTGIAVLSFMTSFLNSIFIQE